MRVLLVKPASAAIDFGLAPFFQTEPLGLQYVASALQDRGHAVAIADMRFERRRFRKVLEQARPDLVGISAVHILDADATRALASEAKAFSRDVCVVVGGHAISMYPAALAGCLDVDAIAQGEGELAMPAICDARRERRPLETVPGLLLPDGSPGFGRTEEVAEHLSLEKTVRPDRKAVARYQRHYCCLNYMPVWTVETARGCRHRCKFCSVWQFHGRSQRFHAIDTVRADFSVTGPNVFIVDDMFWAGRDRSLALADALLSAPTRKNWLLVQSRLDTVVEHPDLLERWRPLARSFDVFFGFEAPTSRGLRSLHKDADVARTVEAVRIARKLGFGVTGNFIIDPDYTEEDFQDLWAFLKEQELSRVGFTILTPLPGTAYFDEMRDRLEVADWSHFDLHHLLWRPRLPVRRFFELYCETWRRSVLYLQGQKKWWRWLPQVRLRDVPRLARILSRTQRLMDPQHYLAQTAIGERPCDGEWAGAQARPFAALSTGRSAGLLNVEPRHRSGP
jgi:radical SAM superfamily enzyme YgiQ (UPF0313 family)